MDSLNIIYQTFRQSAKSLEDRHGSNSVIIGLVVTNLLLFGSAWFVLFSRKSFRAVAVGKHRDVNNINAPSPSFSSPSKQSNCGSDDDANGGIGSQQKQTLQQTTSRQQQDKPQQLRNVFSVKQGPPIKAAISSKNSKQDTTERPFGSSYYYAHNNPNSKGGYKDGLRAEDYVMNGPRLLSKGGVRIDVENSSSSIASSGEKDGNADSRDDNNRNLQSSHSQNDDSDMQQRQTQQQHQSQQKPIAKFISSTPITRYLWDDDATGNVAKIHIDTLPMSSTKSISWQDAGITKECVEARLLGGDNDGLFVAIRQPPNPSENERKYHLHVPKMYKRAEAVKVVVKKHKLIVKITKSMVKKRPRNKRGDGGEEGIWGKVLGMLGSFAKKEEEQEYVSVAWPRLSAASTTESAGDGVVDEIDEKLFKEMDWKGGEDVDF